MFVQIGAPSRTHIKRYHDLLAEVEAEAERINWRFHSLCCALSIIASGERTWATTWPRPSGPSMCSLMQPSGHIPAPESAWAGFLLDRLREHMNHSRTIPGICATLLRKVRARLIVIRYERLRVPKLE